jgi:hypothetical protein
MKWSCVFLSLVVASWLGAELPTAAGTKGDLKPLQGVWLISAFEKDGVKVSPNDAKWIFEGDKYTIKIGT